MTQPDLRDLEAAALRVRGHIIRMAAGGGCFIGAALSCADILVHLYSRVMSVTASTKEAPDRDYFLLSKGHAVPALYGTLVERGFLDRARLSHHLSPRDSIYWHPNSGIPGVEFHSGSLGHLLSVGVGIALDIRLRGGTNRVFVLMGDGELNEGSAWEAVLTASAKRLDNLVLVIDRNELQANVPTETLIPLEPLDKKLEAFGWCCMTADGHDFVSLDRAFAGLPAAQGSPTAVVARTIRGKGVPSIERRVDRWFAQLSDEEVHAMLMELRAGHAARPAKEEVPVR